MDEVLAAASQLDQTVKESGTTPTRYEPPLNRGSRRDFKLRSRHSSTCSPRLSCTSISRIQISRRKSAIFSVQRHLKNLTKANMRKSMSCLRFIRDSPTRIKRQ